MKRPPLIDEDDFEGVEDSQDSDNNGINYSTCTVEAKKTVRTQL